MNSRLTQEIRRRGLMRCWIAEQIGIDPTMLSKIERGTRKASQTRKEQLAALFDMTVDELFPGNENAA